MRTAAFVAVAVAGGLVGGAIVGIARDNADNDTSSNSDAVCTATRVAEQGLPSVVTIHVQAPGGAGSGSGEVIRSDGYIVTNNHVISAAANSGSVAVLFSDGDTTPAHIVGRDPETDLAVIKVDDHAPLPVIAFGSSADLVVGQPVVALGAPLGLASTVTSGIVSALDRSVQVPADEGRTALLVSAIQTDTAINPGNSGGALVDCNAKLVGIPTAGATVPNPQGGSSVGNIGIGFAIPWDTAKTIVDELIATGRAAHTFFGVQVAPIPPSAGPQPGLYVQAVTAGGPAEAAGLAVGDVITTIDGSPAVSAEQLQALTLTRRAGDTVKMEYTRDGTAKTTTLTLQTQP